MTRERASAVLAERLGHASGLLDTIMTVNVVEAMLTYAKERADAEAAAMRERCAKAADDAADHEGPFTDYFQGRDQGCHDAATAIRNLPATGGE